MAHLDHVELATPLTFNYYLGRRRGDFMLMAHTPAKFGENAMGAHTPVAGLFLSGADWRRINAPPFGHVTPLARSHAITWKGRS